MLDRNSFLQRLQWALKSARTGNEQFFALYIGVDGLRSVNDAWGHDAGDRVLQHVAHCVQADVCESDRVATYPGDELAVLVSLPANDNVESVCERILHSCQRPLRESGRDMVVTVSIGAVHPRFSPNDAGEWLRLAHCAMLAAKRAGRNTTHVYRGDIDVPARDRAELATDLRAALESDALHLVYQPQVDVRDARLIGAEALIRWRHPEQGDIPAATLIALAQECGLMRAVTTWSLETAVATLADWIPDLAPGFRLSVNVSPSQMLATDFVERTRAVLRSHGVDVGWLRLEITENFYLQEHETAPLKQLCDAGISLALDDFGTGYSSMEQLARLPIDTVKIDQAFAQHLHDERYAALTRSIVAMGEALDMTVIAEGVETPAQAARLQEFGCWYAQGFLYAAGEEQAVFRQRLAGPITAGG